MSDECDALIIGAGPAGSVAATLLARQGLTVRLVEKKTFPRPKVCGACLSGHAVKALEAAGLARALEPSVPVTAFRLAANGRSALVPLRAGRVLSRPTLDAALAAEATNAGARFTDGLKAEVGPVDGDARLVTLWPPDDPSSRETVRAAVVIVAAGLTGAALRHDPELRTIPAKSARLGAGAETADGPDFYRPGTIFMATGRAGYVGLVRTETGALNVAAALDPGFVTAEGGLGPAAAATVRRAGFPADGLADLAWTGTPPLTRRPKALAADRLFLLGDAAGYVEPFTGEGMGWAVTGANTLAPIAAKAADAWRLALVKEWSKAHERRVGRRQGFCRTIAAALRVPFAAAAATRVLAPCPWAAAPVLRHLAAK